MHISHFAWKLGGGRRLVLAGVEHGWVWLLLGTAVLVLLLVLYRYERRLVTRRQGLALLGLRIAAALALVASLFEPVAERSFNERVRGRVVLGVDISESMATTDPGRSDADRDGLRTALGLSAGNDLNTMPRREVERRLLTSNWLEKLRGTHDLDTVGFARNTSTASPETLAALLANPPKADDLSTEATDWTGVLEQALVDHGGQPILGVVLLSDGRANGPNSSDRSVKQLSKRGIPIFPVAIGSSTSPRDAAIAAVKAPDAVDKGQTARIDVTIKLDGIPAGTEVPVVLERPGAPSQQQAVRAQPDAGRPVVTFRVPLDTVGKQDMKVSVGPIDGDTRPDNDHQSLSVIVTDDQARLLLVDGETRWEFQYLRNAFNRDPRVQLDTVVFHQPSTGAAGDTFYPSALPPLPAPSADPKALPPPDPLGTYDVIILGDVAADDLSPEGWSRCERYVAERGGTLVLASGTRSWPALAEHDTVRKLLPVQNVRAYPIDPSVVDPERPTLPAGTRLLPTRVGANGPWPMLQFGDDVERSQAVWKGLPRQPWALVGSPKPTATALAVATEVALDVDAAPRSEPEPDPDATALAAMPYGLGKVLWVGTDGTWRWRFRVGDAYHHRFWGQVVQWAAHGKLIAGNRLVQFGPVPPRVPDGTAALLRARFADNVTGVDSSLLVAAQLWKASAPSTDPAEPRTPAGDPIAVVPLRPQPDQPRVYEATAPLLPPGQYVVQLDVPQLSEAMQAEGAAPEAMLEVVPRETSERIELAASHDALDRLASDTGGQVFTEADCASLPDTIQQRTAVRTRVESTRLWDRPETLVLFFALLTVEWVMRKRAGLP